MPRPGSPVIHPRMLSAVRGVATSAQTGQCRLLRPTTGAGTLNPVTLTYDATAPTALWTGPCRVQPQSRAGSQLVDAAGEDRTLTGYQVSIALTAPGARPDDLLEVLASSDQLLVGKRLRVVDVAYGDLQTERQLTCQDDAA